MTIRLLTILILTIPTLTIGQVRNDEHETFVFESNLPTEVRDLYEQKIKPAYAIRTDLNPFYLKGDFDADKIQDYAISVVEKKSDKKGILIITRGQKLISYLALENSSMTDTLEMIFGGWTLGR